MGKTIAVVTKMQDPIILKEAIAEYYSVPVSLIQTVADLVEQINQKNLAPKDNLPHLL